MNGQRKDVRIETETLGVEDFFDLVRSDKFPPRLWPVEGKDIWLRVEILRFPIFDSCLLFVPGPFRRENEKNRPCLLVDFVLSLSHENCEDGPLDCAPCLVESLISARFLPVEGEVDSLTDSILGTIFIFHDCPSE